VTALRDSFEVFAREFMLALRRFTRLRPGVQDEHPTDGSAALAQLPGVGWLVGMIACLVFALVSVLLRGNPWSPAVAAVFSTLATVMLTGALHEGALFRTADRLEAVPDSPGSAMGVIASLLLIAGKLALIAALAAASEAAVMAALFAAHVTSRYLPLAVAHWLAPGTVERRALGLSAIWCVVPLLLMIPVRGPAFLGLALLAAVLAAFVMLHLLRRRASGFDDGVLGAVQQVCEAAFYLGAAVAAG
jgi:adenosylcobinamide-GDP ribazoletransferase